jgi:hypothetical protein
LNKTYHCVKSRAKIHQALLPQFSLLAEFFTVKIIVKDQDKRVFNLGESQSSKYSRQINTQNDCQKNNIYFTRNCARKEMRNFFLWAEICKGPIGTLISTRSQICTQKFL